MIRIVYKTTNNITGKIYIGQHSTENLDDGYLGSGVILQKAFKKYGKENFTREIIALTDTQEDLNHTEEFFIKHYRDKIGKDLMYNIAEFAGGGGCHTEESKKKMSATLKGREGWNKGRHLTEETKLKISEARKGQPGTWVGRKHTEESKKKISEARKGRPAWNKGLPGTFTGRKHTEETKLKISKANKGRPGWNKGIPHNEEHKKKLSQIQKNRPDLSKKVLCVETGEIYPSISEASRQTGVAQQTISNVCKKKLITNSKGYKYTPTNAGGYHWKYIEE